MNNADKLALELADRIDRLRGQHQRQRQAPAGEESVLQTLERLRQVREPVSVEQALTEAILNPQKIVRARTTMQPVGNDGVIQEVVEASLFNAQGILEEVKEQRVFNLDDGFPSEGNVAQCQTCGGMVHLNNLKRCLCGKTCCVRPNCGRGNGIDAWFCSGWHLFLGILGLPLR